MKYSESLKKNLDFQKVYRKGTSRGNRYLVMYLLKNETDRNRFGISVSKKVGNSVVRHRMARVLREIYRLNEESFCRGCDLVVIVRNPAKEKSYREIERAMLDLGKQHHILEPGSEKK